MTTIPEEYELLFDSNTIEHAIDQVAVRITLDLADTLPIFVCIMNGGLPFMWDLTKRLKFPLAMDFLYAARYDGMQGGEIRIHTRPQTDLRNRTVVVVDDVIDHGVTLQAVVQELKATTATVRTAVLVDKSESRVSDDLRKLEPDYAALKAPTRFLIGRGMDFDGLYRNLPEIYAHAV
ncbi:MAG: phosphoribosyltransferase family protein [Pseudomonadales bacterium]